MPFPSDPYLPPTRLHIFPLVLISFPTSLQAPMHKTGPSFSVRNRSVYDNHPIQQYSHRNNWPDVPKATVRVGFHQEALPDMDGQEN